MKMTELRCHVCGGDLKIDKDNPDIAVCEYCNTRFLLEKERELREYGEKREDEKEAVVFNRDGGTEDKWRRRAGGWMFWAALCILYGIRLYVRLGMNHSKPKEPVTYEIGIRDTELGKDVESLINTEDGEELYIENGFRKETDAPLTGAIAEMAEKIFGKPAEEITEGELAKIKWLETDRDFDDLWIGYSLDNPYEEEGAALTWMVFSDDMDMGMSCLNRLTGLKKVDLYQHIGEENIKGLELEGIGGYFGSLTDLADMLENPSALKELHIKSTVDSLAGLEKFSGLQVLKIDSAEGLNLGQLVNLPALKSLSVESYGAECNLTVLDVLDGLEELCLEVDGLKSLDFLKGMENLKRLEIKDADILSLNGLANLEKLEALRIEDCDNLKKMELPDTLVGLKELALDLPYDCEAPELGRFRQVEKLELSGFDDCSFLGGMTQLTSLTLKSCTIDSYTDLTGLVNLEELTCSAFMQMGQPLEFVTQFPALKKVNLKGMSTYDDISGIFNITGLVLLDISGMECEIDFDRVRDNPSLEVLRMDGIKLYENVQSGGSNGYYWADWDDVELEGHTDFLAHFQALKELSIADNELTDIGGAAELPHLETINIAGNYISDLRPLAGISSLRQVNCTDNPISNERVLGEDVVIVTDEPIQEELWDW